MRLYLQNVGVLHVPAMRAGLRGLGAISLGVSKSNVMVGEPFTFILRGAPPNAKIYWSSKRNGTPTGEENAYYGHSTDANGNADFNLAYDDKLLGEWIKYVVVFDGAGNAYSAAVAFNVLPQSTSSGSSTTTTGTTSSSTSSGSTTTPAPVTTTTTTPAPVGSASSSYYPSSSSSGLLGGSFSIGGYSISYLTAGIVLGLGYYFLKGRR